MLKPQALPGDQAMKTYCKALLAMAPLSIGLILGAPSHAQTYPQRTIKIIVTATPGGPADLPARLTAQVLNAKFGQPVVVEHRPGAGGAIGAREVAKAPAERTIEVSIICTAASWAPANAFMSLAHAQAQQALDAAHARRIYGAVRARARPPR